MASTTRAGKVIIAIASLAALAWAAGQGRRWAQYEHEMQNPAEDPPDTWEKTEFAFARLRYRSSFDRRYRSRWGIDANERSPVHPGPAAAHPHPRPERGTDCQLSTATRFSTGPGSTASASATSL